MTSTYQPRRTLLVASGSRLLPNLRGQIDFHRRMRRPMTFLRDRRGGAPRLKQGGLTVKSHCSSGPVRGSKEGQIPQLLKWEACSYENVVCMVQKQMRNSAGISRASAGLKILTVISPEVFASILGAWRLSTQHLVVEATSPSPRTNRGMQEVSESPRGSEMLKRSESTVEPYDTIRSACPLRKFRSTSKSLGGSTKGTSTEF